MAETKLFVGNLSWSVDEEKLRSLFSPYGDVRSTAVLANRGFGFVEMSSKQEAEEAKNALNGTQLADRTLTIDIARPRDRGSRRD